jgi:hypothetical protein
VSESKDVPAEVGGVLRLCLMSRKEDKIKEKKNEGKLEEGKQTGK